MANNEIFQIVKENYEEIVLRVGAYAQKLIDSYTWFRGKEALPAGLTAEDFTLEALTRLLEDPGQFDTERSEVTVTNIVAFLNRNVVRNLVRGARKKDENKKSDDLHDDNFEESLPFAEILMADQIDVQTIKTFIEKALSEEEELLELFTGLYEYDLTRAEICEQLNITTKEYDKRMKRLGNRLSTAAKEFAKNAI